MDPYLHTAISVALLFVFYHVGVYRGEDLGRDQSMNAMVEFLREILDLTSLSLDSSGIITAVKKDGTPGKIKVLFVDENGEEKIIK